MDRTIVEANIARVHGRLDAVGLSVRPHVKTHKSPDIAALQLGAGAVGITVATIGEAEVFAGAGCTDIFIAYPVWVDADRARRLALLTETARVAVGVESVEGAEHLAGKLDPRIEVMVEVDSGHHRTGCDPQHAGELAAAVVGAGAGFRGLFSFPGHSYAPGAAADVAVAEAKALRVAAHACRAVGLVPSVISGGSTPSVAEMAPGVLTEARPGVYVFNDAQQWELNRCTREDIALTAYGRVVSRRPGRVVVDAGSKILGGERAAYASGYGRLLDHPEARIVQLSEHHAVVEVPHGQEPALGAVLRVVPNHVCIAVNLVDTLTVVGEEVKVQIWPVTARGANS
ncbi:MAG: alanine racemase [Ornithinimicrobium sp.]|uniref:alanine racemase n=1 Tax=Ornithinimicrobium sp. TaxID=1977084 RepID=UPI003D9AFAC6